MNAISPVPVEATLEMAVALLAQVFDSLPRSSAERALGRTALEAARAPVRMGGARPFDPDALEVTLAAIVRAVGIGPALRLADAHGGERIYIPRAANLQESHRLVGLLGLDAAFALARAFGGDRLKIPKCRRMADRRRREEIGRRYAGGDTARALAREFGMTEDSVYRVVRNRRHCPFVDVPAEPRVRQFETLDLFADDSPRTMHGPFLQQLDQRGDDGDAAHHHCA